MTVSGANPTIYFPYFVRIASTGELVVFDRGLNTLRRLNVSTNTATVIDQLGDGGFGDWARGWVWGDVDRWGNAGARDGIYWGTATSTVRSRRSETGGSVQRELPLHDAGRIGEVVGVRRRRTSCEARRTRTRAV